MSNLLKEERPFRLAREPGLELRGFLSDTGSGPLGIFVHGFISHCEGAKSLVLAEHARSRGYSWLRFDLRGHGRSDGEFRQFRLSAMLSDLEAVLARFADRNIILIGSSMGGWLAVLAALRHPQRIRGLLLIAPAFNFIQRHFDALSPEERAAWERTGVREFESRYEPSRYRLEYGVLDDASQFDLMHASVRLPCPTVIVHGDHDEAVPIAQSRAFVEHATAPSLHLYPVRDGDHRLTEAIPLLCNFLDQLWQEALTR